jgi:hypothetical protein
MTAFGNILQISEVNPPTSLSGISKLKKTIKVVTALPAVLESGVTYLVGVQNTIDITGLNGDVDQLYQIQGLVVCASNQDTIGIRFNNISTNVYDYRISEFSSNFGNSSLNATNTAFMAVNSGNTSVNQFSITIDASTGKNRTFTSSSIRTAVSQNSVTGNYLATGVWRDNSTNLSSILFRAASVTGAFGVGTIIKVFALVP